MSSMTFAELIAAGQAAGGEGFEDTVLVEPGVYDLELNANAISSGKGVFVKGRVQSGTYAGKMVACGTLTLDPEKSAKATGIAVQNLAKMGIAGDVLNTISVAVGGSISESVKAVASVVKGRKVRAELGYNNHPSLGTVNQFVIGKITLLEAPPLPNIGGMPVAVPQAQPAVSAAPATVAPAPAPAPTAPAVLAPPPAPVVTTPVAAAPVDAVAAQPVPFVETAPVTAPAPGAVVAPAPAPAPAAPAIPVSASAGAASSVQVADEPNF